MKGRLFVKDGGGGGKIFDKKNYAAGALFYHNTGGPRVPRTPLGTSGWLSNYLCTVCTHHIYIWDFN